MTVWIGLCWTPYFSLGLLTLNGYAKGEHVLRFEAILHDTIVEDWLANQLPAADTGVQASNGPNSGGRRAGRVLCQAHGRRSDDSDDKVGPDMANIKDVARRAGVAPSSVSRVLTGHPNVSVDLRARVLTAVAEMNYKTDLVAAGLRRGYTRTIGVIVDDILNPMLAELVDVLEVELHASGYAVLIANSRGESTRDLETLGVLRQRRVDGLIAMVADETDADVAQALRELPFPVVLVDRQIGGNESSSVLSDHRGGSRLLTQHLVDCGHRRIGSISGLPTRYPSRERAIGMAEVLSENCIPLNDGYHRYGRGTEEFGRQSLAELLALPDPPTAVFIGNTRSLVGALRESDRRLIALGLDLVLVAGDDVPWASLHTPPITAISRDMSEVGRHAVSLLTSELADPGRKPRSVVLPTRLVPRVSTAM